MSVTPIRPGLAPEGGRVDAFCDWATENVKTFAVDDEPVSVAIAIIGKKTSAAVCWAGEEHPMNLALAYAAALFQNRSTQEE